MINFYSSDALATEIPSIEALELFAGAGGLALGMSAAQIQHREIVEWNHYACETIRANKKHGIASVAHWPDPLEADVRDIDFKRYEDIPIVSGGVPCQPFSMGGKHRAHLDPRDMFPQAVRAIRDTRPVSFLFENVRGLARPTFANYFAYIRLQLEYPNLLAKQNEEWISHLARLERHKTSGGKSEYHVVHRVLDAADYGVPQRRHRVFIVGIRADLSREFSFPDETHSLDRLLFDQYVSGTYWDEHEISKRRRPRLSPGLDPRIDALRSLNPELVLEKRWRTVRDAIADLPDPQKVNTHNVQAHEFQPGARSYPGHTGSPLDEPSKALKAGDHGVPGGENMLRRPDGAVRYFTIRESARIQCFPDDYAFAGSWGETMRQLGNAVPVKLAEVVARQLIQVIK